MSDIRSFTVRKVFPTKHVSKVFRSDDVKQVLIDMEGRDGFKGFLSLLGESGHILLRIGLGAVEPQRQGRLF